MTKDAKYRARQAKAGTKGGQTTKKRHGTKFFQRIAQKRWRMVRRKRDV